MCATLSSSSVPQRSLLVWLQTNNLFFNGGIKPARFLVEGETKHWRVQSRDIDGAARQEEKEEDLK